MQRFEATRLLSFGLAAAGPAGILLALILRYGVDVPYWDQWDVAPFFDQLSRGTLSFADLFRQQNEYRQFFPQLVFVGLGWLTRWDVRYEMVFSFLLACLVSFNVYRLGKITVGGDGWQRPLLFLVSNLLIFSPIQYENWLFGVQVVYFAPVACVTASLLVACSGLGPRAKFLLCGLLATVSTFSAANGILCWVVTAPALALSRRRGESEGGGRWRAAAWAAGFALSAALYLSDWERSAPSYPSISEPLLRPLVGLTYFLAFLGGPLAVGPRPLPLAVTLGTVLVALYAAAGLYVLRRRDAALTRRATVWLMLGAFSVLSAALVTFGRAGYGPGQALSSRYTTFSLHLIVALVHLTPLILEDLAARGHPAAARRAAARLAAPAALALVLAYPLVTFLVIRHGMRATWRERLHMKACLPFVNVVEDECAAKLYTEPALLRRRAAALDRLGFLRPPLLRSGRVRDIEGGGGEGPDSYGSFERLERDGDGGLVAAGRARLPRAGRPADAVLLAYETDGGEAVVFALAEAGAAGAPEGWRKSFSLGKLPASATRLSAWAFDSTEGKAYKLSGTHLAP